MSLARHDSGKREVSSTVPLQQDFTFPDNQHLLIATPSHLYTWDSAGVHIIFRSSKRGIVAAEEAKDGSGVLAVANRHVVVLHDTRRGKAKSWGLGSEDDEVRHLEYTADAKSLFLSTKLTADIQRYSTERSRLLSPAKAHATPPVALAISSTGHLMVSASDDPPVVYLKNLTLNTSPTLLDTRASDAGVSVIVFHPERPNVFLIAFKDGTAAAFDATRIARAAGGTFSNQESVNAGEIGHLDNLHRTTASNKTSACITDAAFLPGFKTRAVTVGADGRCRLIDFADKGTILRTWHAKAPVVSVAVTALRRGFGSESGSGRGSTDTIIAIGRQDGRVLLYNSVGLVLSQKPVSFNDERIISVKWANGPSPKPIEGPALARTLSDPPSLKPTKSATVGSGSAPSKNQTIAGASVGGLGGGSADSEPVAPAGSSLPTTGAVRKFTTHPDEVDESTVRHTPMPLPAASPPGENGRYLDLFSPVKPVPQKRKETRENRVVSPPHSRPRISSQTFLKSPEPTQADEGTITTKPRNLALFPSTDSGSEPVKVQRVQGNLSSLPNQAISNATPPKVQSKFISLKPSSTKRKRASPTKTQTIANHNAGVLANLRKMSATHPTQRSRGILSGYGRAKSVATLEQPENTCSRRGPHILHRPNDHVEIEPGTKQHPHRAYEEAHKRLVWPEDSNQDTSLEEDIWLTSDTDTTVKNTRNRRRLLNLRPPVRATSRSRVAEDTTLSSTMTGHAPPPLPPSSAPLAAQRLAMDGSTEDEATTARPRAGVDGSMEDEAIQRRTHLSPSGEFSPSSKDVRELFPRSSSLSPRRKSNKTARRLVRSPPVLERTLREIAVNAVPLDSRTTRKPRKIHEPVELMLTDGMNDLSGTGLSCERCAKTKGQVHDLEGEVARLKGEILALKAMLRRSGILLPSGESYWSEMIDDQTSAP